MPALCGRLGIPIIWQPFNLPRLIRLSGNIPPATVRNKGRYLLRDLKRWSQHLDIPFRMIMPGSFDSRLALASTHVLDDKDRETLATVIFNALWADGIDYREPDWLDKAVSEANLPVDWILSDTYLHQLDKVNSITAALHKAGAFGAPTFFLRGAGRTQMFWGIDRLDFLIIATEKALTGN